jgi:hypothetical protein
LIPLLQTMPTIDELTNEIREVALLVHAAQEQSDDRERVIAAYEGVERLSQRYRELTASLSEGEKMRVERNLGRRVTDLRRLASGLPRIGILAGSTPDRQVAGASVAGERRITGVTWRNDEPKPRPDAAHVGGEIEAWCGPCERMTTHKIVAMVATGPKQVVCDACGGRHNYRTTPARKGTAEPAAAPSRQVSAQEAEAVRKAEQKAEELRALAREVAEAAQVKLFAPRERYRPGDIISHPDYGRGKVETVLRSSMLVRFPNGGLKSLMLM